MDVHAIVFDLGRIDAKIGGVRPDVALSDLGRLLHDLAELARQREVFPARKQNALHIEHVATGFGPGQTGSHAWRDVLAHLLGQKELRAEQIAENVRDDRDFLSLTLLKPQADPAGYARNGALQLAQTSFARVSADDS